MQLTQGVCPALRKGLCAVVCGVFWASVVVCYLVVLCAAPCAWFPAAVQHSASATSASDSVGHLGCGLATVQ